MWIYEKKLEFPVKIKKPDARFAKIMLEQYGGIDGELSSAVKYLSQRFTMPTPEVKATLNDIATEELAHFEIMGTIFYELTKGLSVDDIKKADLSPYYVSNGLSLSAVSANMIPFSSMGIHSKGDPIADIYDDMALEQKSRVSYEYLISLTDDPDILRPLRFLREREIVHFQRFGECLDILQGLKAQKSFFAISEKPDLIK